MKKNNNSFSPKILFWFVLFGFPTVWWLSQSFSFPYLDDYGDMGESYVWSQTWMWASFKHPPLMVWAVKIWFSVFPETATAYFLLSYVNATVGVLGIVALAKLHLPKSISDFRKNTVLILVVLFTFLSFPYSNLAGKFNADTILISVWPWTAYAFLKAVNAVEKKQQLLWSFSLGLLGALAMLGKYYSGVLLLSFVFTTVCYRPYWAWYKSIYPYLSVIIFVFFLLPHGLWEWERGFPLQSYLSKEVTDDGVIDFYGVIEFWLSGIYYLFFSWVVWSIMRVKLAKKKHATNEVNLAPLIMLCLFPALITGLFHIFFLFFLTIHWSIPIWFALPALLGIWLAPYINNSFNLKRLVRNISFFFIFIFILTIIYMVFNSLYGKPRYNFDHKVMADEVIQRFEQSFPKKELSWVGGTWPYSSAISFFSENHPRGLPDFPDEYPAIVNPYNEWSSGYGVILCVPPHSYASLGTINEPCRTKTKQWLVKHHLPIMEEAVIFQASGWRYMNADKKNIHVFWVMPTTDKSLSIKRNQ